MIFSRAAPSETGLRFEDALLVGPAVNERLNGALGCGRGRGN